MSYDCLCQRCGLKLYIVCEYTRDKVAVYNREHKINFAKVTHKYRNPEGFHHRHNYEGHVCSTPLFVGEK